ncbi:hypothetical protein A2U01_0060276, partial [Trifolium medium]|nr:hypothetical protein [Trifolium medium]
MWDSLVGATSWGWCVRDHRVSFILAGSNFIEERLDIIMQE